MLKSTLSIHLHCIMKNILFALFLSSLSASILAATPPYPTCDPDLKVVVTPKKVWFVHDETPMKYLTAQIQDATGKVLLEKNFNLKDGDWSVDIAALPEGKYRVAVGGKVVKRFEK